MSNYTKDELVTFLSAYDLEEPDPKYWRIEMTQGAWDFIDAYGLVPSEHIVEKLLIEYEQFIGELE